MAFLRQAVARSTSVVAVAVSMACGGAPPASPSLATASVAITGLPAAVPYGSPLRLKAELLVGTTASDCTSQALWQVDNLAVASITGAGELTGLQSGFVTVTATCDGVSASGRTMVQRLAPRVFLSTCDPSPSFDCALDGVDVNATVEFLDGPRAGEVMSENAVITIPPKTLLLPIKIRVSARFYETQEFILSENTSVFEDGGHIAFVVLMKFVGDSSTDSYVKTWPSGEIYPFRTRSAGQIEIGTYWHYDDPSHYVRMITELWCDGSRVALGGEGFGLQHTGVVLSHAVTGPSACEVRIPHTEVYRYRLTVTYPH